MSHSGDVGPSVHDTARSAECSPSLRERTATTPNWRRPCFLLLLKFAGKPTAAALLTVMTGVGAARFAAVIPKSESTAQQVPDAHIQQATAGTVNVSAERSDSRIQTLPKKDFPTLLDPSGDARIVQRLVERLLRDVETGGRSVPVPHGSLVEVRTENAGVLDGPDLKALGVEVLNYPVALPEGRVVVQTHEVRDAVRYFNSSVALISRRGPRQGSPFVTSECARSGQECTLRATWNSDGIASVSLACEDVEAGLATDGKVTLTTPAGTLSAGPPAARPAKDRAPTAVVVNSETGLKFSVRCDGGLNLRPYATSKMQVELLAGPVELVVSSS